MKEKNKKLIIYILMCIFTLVILFFVLKIGMNKKNYDMKISYIDKYLTEVKYDDLKINLLENPKTIIYVSDSSLKETRKFEKLFKNVIKKYNLENDIYYINIYNSKISSKTYKNAPEIIFYKETEIIDIIDCNLLEEEEDIINIFIERDVIND